MVPLPAGKPSRKAARKPAASKVQPKGVNSNARLKPSRAPVVTAPASPPAAKEPLSAPIRRVTRLPAVGFDPATGDWTKPAAPAATVDPAAPRRGKIATTLWVLLILDLVALGWLLLNSVYAGAVLGFAPNSDEAEQIRNQLANTDVMDIVLNSVLSLVLFGAIPFAWVMGTRQVPWAGTRKYLHLNGTWAHLGKAVLLTIPILIGVSGFLYLYVLATEGPDGVKAAQDQENPAVDALLDHMTLPIALVVSLSAGIGEELMFRGLLQKRLGLWGQAGLFGIAHSAGGYLPQILFAFALAVLFGWLLKSRGWPLWALMVTHFLYDFTLLAGAVFGADF